MIVLASQMPIFGALSTAWSAGVAAFRDTFSSQTPSVVDAEKLVITDDRFPFHGNPRGQVQRATIQWKYSYPDEVTRDDYTRGRAVCEFQHPKDRIHISLLVEKGDVVVGKPITSTQIDGAFNMLRIALNNPNLSDFQTELESVIALFVEVTKISIRYYQRRMEGWARFEPRFTIHISGKNRYNNLSETREIKKQGPEARLLWADLITHMNRRARIRTTSFSLKEYRYRDDDPKLPPSVA